MFDRIINILVVESNKPDLLALLKLIQNPGHNIFTAENQEDALNLLKEKRFALIFCSLDFEGQNSDEFLNKIYANNISKNATIIVTTAHDERVLIAVEEKGTHLTIDYLIKPYHPHLVNAKVGVYKKLYFKHQRVSRLLESILPAQTLSEFSLYGKSSPKKKSNCTVLFTDFVNFTRKTINSDPQEIVQKLDGYFTRFDEIILKYKLEKIKTIGDAYMAVGGVTETDPHPAIRTALAAIEIRNLMVTDIATQRALKRDYWEIRIGIHCGDLIAGVLGKNKFSFDVWGDTVNVAARCEQHSVPNHINISERYAKLIDPYFNTTPRGNIKIKNAGEIGMFFLADIRDKYSLYKEGRIPNVDLRKAVGLPLADFAGLRSFILTKLKAELDDKLRYHSSEHTVNVEEAVLKYAELEELSPHQLFLVQTAALFHDSGFLFRYDDNEELGVELFQHYAPKFGYQQDDIDTISEIIMCTVYGAEPKNLLEAIMCDADLDYLGRVDYHVTAAKLFDEMELNGRQLDSVKKLEMQIDYLENVHQYYTVSAKNLRNPGKKKRIEELKNRLKTVKNTV